MKRGQIMNSIKQIIIKNGYENLLFGLVAVFFGLSFVFVPFFGDDVLFVEELNGSITKCIQWVTEQYYTWSSRQFVNFVWAIMIIGGRGLWCVYMAVSMFVLLKSLSFLFFDNKDIESTLFIIATVIMFPFHSLSTAGWMATTVSYFCPQAFAVLSLIPIKKVFKDERLKISEILFYSITTLYASNAEQMSVVLLVIYLIALIYSRQKRKQSSVICLLFGVTLFSLIYMLTCPGNNARSVSMNGNWFPHFGMFDIIDKIDIGLTFTLSWLYGSNNLIIIVLIVLLAYLVRIKYGNKKLFSSITLVPIVVTLLLGPFNRILEGLFPYGVYITNEVNMEGSFIVENHGLGLSVIQFALFIFVCGCIVIELLLIHDSFEAFLIDIVLIIVGGGSEVMMGLTPSLYASGDRTCTTLVVCLMMLIVHIYSCNRTILKKENSPVMRDIFCMISILCIINYSYMIFSIV